MICQVSLFSRFLLLLSIPQTKQSNVVSTRLFFRLGKDQKSPSVVPIDLEPTEAPEDFTTEINEGFEPGAIDSPEDASSEDITEIEIFDSVDSLDSVDDYEYLPWDPLAEEAELTEVLEKAPADLEKPIASDKEDITEDGTEEVAEVPNSEEAETFVEVSNEEPEISAVNSEVVGADGANGADGLDGESGDSLDNSDDADDEVIAEDQVLDDLADETLDTSEDQDVVETGDEESDPVVDVANDVNEVADDIEKVDDAESEEVEQEELELLGDSSDTEPNLLSQVESGFYTVDATGKVEFTFVFDSGAYEGQLAAISMTGMENLDLNSQEFFQESLQRALSGSEAKLGYIVIDDISAGAMFSGELEPGFDYNYGEFAGTSIVEFNSGDKFFLMLIPNGSVAEVEEALEQGTTKDVRPLFSLVAANPTKAIQMGQIVDVTGDGNTYVFEDIRQDGVSDKDFNDLIFQVKGATITTVTLDELILEGEMSPEADWRNTEIGQQIVDYAASQVVIVPEPNPVEKYEFPKEDQPLVGFIDTHFTQGNPDIDYSRIIFGKDYIQNDSDPTIVAVAGEGTHGDHILGIVAATQDNGVGIEGINDDAPLWVSSAVESGKWADALVEFVDAAKASNQPNAIINLSIDLTQVNPDGTVTTRYEFTPQERTAIEYARQNGVLIVAAAGNDGGVMSVLGQASQEFDNIITVGAAKSTVVPGALPEFTRAEYSSFGNGLDVMAEGGTIDNPVISTAGDSLGLMAGTSVAAAKVTGVTSQVWAANPELSYRQVISILKQSATDLGATGWDADTGFGLVNIAAAVGLAKTTIPEVYKPTPWFAPDTWSGAGIAIPMERAVGRLDGISTSGRHQYFGSSNSIDEITFTLNRNIPLFQFTTNNGSIRVVDSNGNTLATSSSSSPTGEARLNRGTYKIVANYTSSSSSKMIKLNFDNLPPSEPFAVSRIIPASPTSGGGGGQIPIIIPPPIFTDKVGFDGSTHRMTYRNTYFTEGGLVALGTPSENVFRNFSGYMQHFTGGSKGKGAIMKSDVSDASYWVGGEIWNKYIQSGAISNLGYPISSAYSVNGYPFQRFQYGDISLAPAFNDGVGFDGSTYRMTYRNTYFNEGGQSALGTRRENVFRNGAGYMQHFTGGSKGSGAIMKSDVSDASYWVGGEIWKKFNEGGSINRYGYPISAVSYRDGIPFQQFQRGTLLGSFPGDNKVPGNAVYVNTVARTTSNSMITVNYDIGKLAVQPSGNSYWYPNGPGSALGAAASALKNIPKIRVYSPNIESTLNNYFSNKSNTNNEDWTKKSPEEKWDRVGGSSAQYGKYKALVGGDKWTTEMPSDVLKIYEDLSTRILGVSKPVTAGYAYDEGYYPTPDGQGGILGAHSGIDIQTIKGELIKSATRGKVVYAEDHGSLYGWWIAVDELTSDGQRTGRRWWYGHLNSSKFGTLNSSNVKIGVGDIIVNAGDVIGDAGDGTGYKHHLHLLAIKTYSDPPKTWKEVDNGVSGNYIKDVNNVLNRTISPLQAYWNSRNGIKEVKQ
jgi:murein DD-endopeptidase MepM/ murein hydrolase activator NlpD/ribosomal protein S6E (S10)